MKALSNKEKTSKGSYKACWESHPKLPIKVGNETFYVSGGSCHHAHDVDVFVGLDGGMIRSADSYPWNEKEHFMYFIQDMGVPKSIKSFKALIEYLAKSLGLGKTVFVGCIGGHGRTGTVFAALVTYMTGELDSITYVRKHYCKKAVESDAQIEWLNKHFKIVKVACTKPTYANWDKWGGGTAGKKQKTLGLAPPSYRAKNGLLIKHINTHNKMKVFGDNVKVDNI